jgi:pimeloyl-ACP methyl ester carboxylesterase
MKNTTIKSSVLRNKVSSTEGNRNGNAKYMISTKADKRKIDYTPISRVLSLFEKTRFLVLMGMGMILVASSGLNASSSAFASTQSNTTEPQQTQGISTSSTNATTTGTNIVLVHGAWADGSSWSNIIPTLTEAGHRVIAVQLPLHSLADDVATVNRAIQLVGGPVLLVGHSYGGFVITNAGYNNPNVTGLVYIAGFAPDEGQSISNFVDSAALPPGFFIFDSGGFGYINPDMFHQAFVQDVNETEAEIMAIAQKPAHQSLLAEPSGPPAWKQLPTWYQVSESDHIIPPDAERQFAQQMNATTISIDASHASLVSHPDEIAQFILSAAGGSTG